MESHVEYSASFSSDPEDLFYDPPSITLDIAPDSFRCPTCHQDLDKPELLGEASLDDLFQAEGDPEDFEDGPEYENE